MRLPLPAWLMIAPLLLAGCGPSRVPVELQARSPVNVDESGASRAVAVRLYQLKSDGRFRSATVDALWTGDRKVLGDDLVGEPQVVTVLPTSGNEAPQRVEVLADPATRFLGVLALYRKADAQDHRSLVLPIDEVPRNILRLTGFAVQAVPPGAAVPTPAGGAR